ncbi:MAG TPA: RagB/SusD family nutrient uptake outer membrane protein [Longimicrobium sp.]|jgi:hypothetical protein
MNRRALLPLLAGALALGACDADLTIPNYNSPSIGDLQANPTNSGVLAATTGLLIGTRQDQAGYVRIGAIPGREGYFVDPNEGRYVRQLAAGTPDASDFTGGSYWAAPYNAIRTGNLILSITDDPRLTFSASERASIKGFVKTMQAFNFVQILNWREQIPIAVGVSPEEAPAPLVSRAEAFAFISTLLDEGNTDLGGASGSFTFSTGPGLSQFGFNDAATFRQFNRGLKARVEVYRATLGHTATPSSPANYTAALTALSGSFISTADASRAGLNRGLYFSYSSLSGDLTNSNFDNSGRLIADNRNRTEAQLQAGGARDARLLLKQDSAQTNRVSIGLTSTERFRLYDTRPFFGAGGSASPIPAMRNEELILLRAEARYFTNDLPGALSDLNFVRTNSGGLAPLVAADIATPAQFITRLLYERRYSLLFEGGHRWIDHRRFGRLAELNSTGVSDAARANDKTFAFFPLPINEQLARGL